MCETVENAEMRSLVSTLNKLQDATSVVRPGGPSINLPQMCVVGSQSSGKSSVLENIVGRSFLPRGTGIVTRRPLVLMMLQTQGLTEGYAEFTHRPGERFTSDAAIRAEIEADTDRECGVNKGLNPKPINLRFYSAHVPNLTLVDLPGITQNPVGDQPDDIGAQIKQMVLEYVQRPNCIMLAVTAANTDLANSDAIAIARQVDPEGSRTLGVLTKLDLMDRGTDAAALLEGKGLGMRPGKALGYVGVVNRSQKDIDDGKQLANARLYEQKFFAEHSAYAPPAACHALCGTPQLVKRCTSILQHHIRTVLPSLAADLDRLLTAKRARLAQLKAEQDPDTRDRLRMGALVAYADAADSLVRGLTHTHTRDAHTLALLSSGELVGGAKIERLLCETFARGVQERDVFQLVGANEILTLAKNMTGLGGGLFNPSRAFDAVVVRYVRSLEDVCLHCVAEVRAELSQLLREVRLDALDCFPPLEAAVKAQAERVLAAEVGETEALVRTLLAMEACRVNLHHADFVGRPSNMSHVMEEVRAELAAFQRNPLAPLAYTAEPQQNLMEGGVSRRSEERGLLGIDTWQERHLVLGKDRVLRVYKQKVDALREHEVVGLEQLPESLMLHGARAERADEATGRANAVRLCCAGKQKELVFACGSAQEATGWVRALSQAAEELSHSTAGSAAPRLSAAELLSRSAQENIPPRACTSSAVCNACCNGSAVPVVADAAVSGLPPLPAESCSSSSPLSWPAQVAHLNLSSGEMYEWGLMYKLLLSYTSIVQKTLADLVPKAITHRLVDTTLEKLRLELLRAFGPSSTTIDALMVVSEEAEKECHDTEKLVQTLSEYEAILRQVAGSGSAGGGTSPRSRRD